MFTRRKLIPRLFPRPFPPHQEIKTTPPLELYTNLLEKHRKERLALDRRQRDEIQMFHDLLRVQIEEKRMQQANEAVMIASTNKPIATSSGDDTLSHSGHTIDIQINNTTEQEKHIESEEKRVEEDIVVEPSTVKSEIESEAVIHVTPIHQIEVDHVENILPEKIGNSTVDDSSTQPVVIQDIPIQNNVISTETITQEPETQEVSNFLSPENSSVFQSSSLFPTQSSILPEDTTSSTVISTAPSQAQPTINIPTKNQETTSAIVKEISEFVHQDLFSSTPIAETIVDINNNNNNNNNDVEENCASAPPAENLFSSATCRDPAYRQDLLDTLFKLNYELRQKMYSIEKQLRFEHDPRNVAKLCAKLEQIQCLIAQTEGYLHKFIQAQEDEV